MFPSASPSNPQFFDVDSHDAFLEEATGATCDSLRLGRLRSSTDALEIGHATVEGQLLARTSALRIRLASGGLRYSLPEMQRYLEKPEAYRRMTAALNTHLSSLPAKGVEQELRGELAALVEATRIHRRRERDIHVTNSLRTTLSSRAGLLRWLDARPPVMSEENVPLRTEAQLFAYLNWRRGGNSPSQALRLMILPPVDERFRRIQAAFDVANPRGRAYGAQAAFTASQVEAAATADKKARMPAPLAPGSTLNFRPVGQFHTKLPLSAVVRAWYPDWPPSPPSRSFPCCFAPRAPAPSLPRWGQEATPAWQKAPAAQGHAGVDKKGGWSGPGPGPGPGHGGAAPADPRDEAFAYWATRLRATLRNATAQITEDSFLLFHFINPHMPTASIWAVADSDESGACLHIVGGGLVRLHDAPVESDKLLWVVAMLMMFSLTNSMSYWLLDFQPPPAADSKSRHPRRRRRVKAVKWGYAYTREFDLDPDLAPEGEAD